MWEIGTRNEERGTRRKERGNGEQRKGKGTEGRGKRNTETGKREGGQNNDKTRSTEDIKSSKTHGLNACHPLVFDLKPPKVAEETPKSLQRSPKRPPRGPNRSPRDLQNAPKTILKDKKSNFQKSMNVSAKLNVFEVRRVILGVQNRPQEAPREDKKQLRRRYNNKRRKEGQQGRQKDAI